MAANQQGAPKQAGANQPGSINRGFASMDPERQREIASVGGKAAHQRGTAHEFTSQEARDAGSKGGQAAHLKGTAHEFNAEEARLAGSKGGQAAHQKGTAHQFDSEQARAAGRKGGQARRAALQPHVPPAIHPDDGEFAPGEDGICH
jgi:general stress protein YciG